MEENQRILSGIGQDAGEIQPHIPEAPIGVYQCKVDLGQAMAFVIREELLTCEIVASGYPVRLVFPKLHCDYAVAIQSPVKTLREQILDLWSRGGHQAETAFTIFLDSSSDTFGQVAESCPQHHDMPGFEGSYEAVVKGTGCVPHSRFRFDLSGMHQRQFDEI